jgi:glutaredoxin|tara:strand:- start:279 stop:578 length:300 start_codon:yes stop_codon:yes gene_type:complete
MKDLSVVVYTMKGCPFCVEFKEMLTNEGIEFFDRDIDDYKDEYDIFVEVTDNDMIPAMLIIEGDDDKHESFLYAPERNYNELVEAVSIIQGHRQKLGLI